ncbi:MAG: SdrD B-like domain-containing protein [Patescibacteria group bacterium]
MWQRVFRDKRIIGILAILVVLAAVPLTLDLAKQQQDNRQRAAETGQVCTSDQATDTMMIFDQSGSMAKATSDTDSTPRIDSAKKAATAFLDILAKRTAQPLHAVSLTTISTDIYSIVEVSLTRDLTKTKDAINALVPKGGTCIECGIRNAMADFGPNERNGVKNVAVMLTDGGATQYVGGVASTTKENETEAEKRALAAAVEANTKYHMSFYTIGFGDSVNDQLLVDIANQTGGKYYFAPNAATLTTIYQQIAQDIGKGGISGDVFNDTNNNQIQDATETGVADWKVSLINQSTHAVLATTTTDATGHYTFTGVCDGAYEVKLTLQVGWTQTTPSNDASQTVLISQANNVTDKDFGVNLAPKSTSLVCSPTGLENIVKDFAITLYLKDGSGVAVSGIPVTFTVPSDQSLISVKTVSGTTNTTGQAAFTIGLSQTPTAEFHGQVTFNSEATNNYAAASCSVDVNYIPNRTSFNFTAFLHGIGKSGDNANPSAFSLSNQQPQSTIRNLNFEIFDEDGNKKFSNTVGITYASSTGNYAGGNSFGPQENFNLTAGAYTMRLITSEHLAKRIPIIQIIPGNTITVPAVSFVAGDADNNNALNVLDYDLIIGCYSDFEAPVSCTTDSKTRTDLNDDGSVNQTDYNLFLRELSVQNGD